MMMMISQNCVRLGFLLVVEKKEIRATLSVILGGQRAMKVCALLEVFTATAKQCSYTHHASLLGLPFQIAASTVNNQ